MGSNIGRRNVPPNVTGPMGIAFFINGYTRKMHRIMALNDKNFFGLIFSSYSTPTGPKYLIGLNHLPTFDPSWI
jgi:hypothetical protein